MIFTGINLAEKLRAIDKPTFVTSSKSEVTQVKDLTKFANPTLITYFEPSVEEFHGSKTLWESVNGYETYWLSLKAFLKSID